MSGAACPFCGISVLDSQTRSALLDAQLGPVDGARFAPGRLFASRYRIVTLLGRGAMGEVYRAEDLRIGQPVALKLLATSSARDSGGLRRFISEVRLARGIAHPNVCRVFDIGQAEGWHYLSMEYVDGETLASLLHRIGALPVVKAVDIARQLCAGLAAAHERGVLHRDLKPSNIMLDGRGRVRIVDFGLAVSTDDTAAAEVAGTPAYMAPEQFTGDTVTARTDLYSLGLVLYEILTGRRPFAATSHYERMRQAHEGRVLVLGSAVDAAFAEVVRACLERDPVDRPASALQVAALLPGGDPIAAALAEGRVPSPDMLAAAAGKGTLRMPTAWALLASAVAGTLFLAWQGQVLTVSHADLPRPPEVLAQRARDILAKLPDGGDAVDWEFWFDSVPTAAGAADLRFMYSASGC
jgi:serine/threonine-protein kinase